MTEAGGKQRKRDQQGNACPENHWKTVGVPGELDPTNTYQAIGKIQTLTIETPSQVGLGQEK